MIFDWYEEGQETRRVVVLDGDTVLDLNDGSLYYHIDFENEVEEILVDDIFNY